jgi:hypothetical protein
MLRNPTLLLVRGIVDLKVPTNHISDRQNIAQENPRRVGRERPCLITVSAPDKRPMRQKVP